MPIYVISLFSGSRCLPGHFEHRLSLFLLSSSSFSAVKSRILPSGVSLHVDFFMRLMDNLWENFWDLECVSFQLTFGPGGFACATRAGVAMFSWPLLLPSFGLSFFSFFIFLLLLLTHFGETPETEYLFPPIFWHN